MSELFAGLRSESLYYNAYWRLRQPILQMLFDGVSWDAESAKVESAALSKRKDDIKNEIDAKTGDFRLYTITRHRSDRLVDLLSRQRTLREAKKGFRKGVPGWREAKDAFDENAALIKALRSSGGDVKLERGDGLSAARIGQYLYEELKVRKRWKRRKESGKLTPTVDDVALKRISQEHPNLSELISLILEHRRCEKLVSTYLNPSKLLSPIDGRFHSHLKTFGTQSGRLSSSSDPWGFGGNMQNIDREYKWLYLPN